MSVGSVGTLPTRVLEASSVFELSFFMGLRFRKFVTVVIKEGRSRYTIHPLHVNQTTCPHIDGIAQTRMVGIVVVTS